MKLLPFASLITLTLCGCLAPDSSNDESAVSSHDSALGASGVELVLKHSGSALTVRDESTADGAVVEQSTRIGTPGQRWDIRPLENDTYAIVNVNSGKCLDVAGVSKERGAVLQQWSCWGGPNQAFRLQDTGDGQHLLVSVNSGQCVDIAGWSTDDGAKVEQWDCQGSPNQQIAFVAPREPSHRADWMRDAKYGVMMHFLIGDSGSLASAVGGFNVDKLADQLADVGAGYIIFTLGQNSGFFNAPNATYESIAGYAPGERCARRDLPMDLADALAKRGIKLMLYLPSQAPNEDARAQSAFGLPVGPTDQPIDEAFARRWASVIQEWSDRYGDKVAGFWFDGGYAGTGFNDAIAQIYADAVHHGNPSGAVAFNPGIELTYHVSAEDYTAGEIWDNPLDMLPKSQYVEGSQWHMMTFLGHGWGARDTRFDAGQLASWMKQVSDRGGVVSLDVGPGGDGVLAEEQMSKLRAVRMAVRGY